MMPNLSRRRFIAIAASACATTQVSAASRSVATWRGHALGARADLAIAGLSQAEATPLFRAVEAELSRMEDLFSLYRSDSALSRLNRHQVLPDPPPELLQLLTLAASVHRLSGGAFDPTVQPLFALHAEAQARGQCASPDAIHEVRRRIGFQRVLLGTNVVRLHGNGAGLTLNGIAQGFATDRIAALLSREGLHDVLVNAGEIRAVGDFKGQGWPVSAPGGRTIRLADRSIATSSASGTLVDTRAGVGHIFDPRGEEGTPRIAPVTVLHESAAIADAVSTAAVVMSDGDLSALRSLGAEIWSNARRLA